jgi:hypothetical protein
MNFCASPKSTETPSFESLISQNDQHHGGEDDPEEPIATKKEPKVLNAAAIAAQTLNNPPLQPEAELDLTADSLSQKTPDSETSPAIGTSTKGDSNAGKITDTTGKKAQVEQNGALQSNDGNPAAQEAQNIPPEIKPSITSTIRLPKLKSGNAENPLPVDDAQTKYIPTLPTTEKIQTSIEISPPKSENTDSTESTNPIAPTENLQLAVGQTQSIPYFSAVSATTAPTSQPNPPETEKSNQQPSQQIPSPTLQAALASTILPTNLQPASGELIADTGSGDATPLDPAPFAISGINAKPSSPNSKPPASAIPAATQDPQSSSPDPQQPEQATTPADPKPPADSIKTTENQKNSPITPPTVGTSVGMDHAMKEAKMISLATFDTIESSTVVPATASEGLEASSTSSNPISSPKPLAVSNTAPLPGAEKGADSAFAQLASGNPLPASSPEAHGTSTHAASQAAAVLKTLPPEISRLQQSNQSQIQLDLPVGDNESVRIRLSLRGGEIHSTFITESPELRDALQKAWPDFTATHRTQGMRFADSQFQDGLRQQNDAASDQGRQRQYQQESSAQSSDHRQSIIKKNIPQPPTQTNRQGKLNLWA